MYLVIGSTGNVGGALVTELRRQGHDVRAFVRDASRAGQFPDGQRGTPVDLAEALQKVNERFRAVVYETLADDIENLTGTAPGTFRGWCDRHADAFR